MQPNEQPQHPIDYLDSIATTPKGSAKKANDMLFFGAIIAALVVVALVGAFAFLNGGSSSKDHLSRLSVRLTNLQKVSDNSKKNIVSSELRAINANISLAFTNANRDIKEHLTSSGIEPDSISEAITSEESTEELTTTLEDARLNAKFDRTYAREMNYQLETLITLLRQAEEESNDAAEKEFLSTTAKNLSPLQKRLASFNAATS